MTYLQKKREYSVIFLKDHLIKSHEAKDMAGVARAPGTK